MLSDITAAPMEMTLLGVQGKVSMHHTLRNAMMQAITASLQITSEPCSSVECVQAYSTDVQVHEGMMSAATFVHCNTAEALEAAEQKFPGWPVLVTGHSYGGGSQGFTNSGLF